MERMLVSHKNYSLHVLFQILFFVSFLIFSQSAWSQTNLNLEATWTIPTTNANGTPLTDLASYNLYETNSTDSPSAKTLIANISAPAAQPHLFSVTVSDSSGTLYFVITAVDTYGNESVDSGIASYNYNVSPPPPSVTYTVATDPSGLQVNVDGQPYPDGTTFSWVAGSKHTLAVTSPQPPNATGVRYPFSKWDNGSTSQTRQITVPSTSATYTATFTTQYSLSTSVSPSSGGTVTPANTTWYNSGKTVSVSAKPNFGYTFANWSGVSGIDPLSLPMTGPMTVVANFAPIPEQVSTPTTPKNVTNGFTGTSYTFSTKSTSNLRNPVQYQYNWGDGTTSGWGPTTQSHFWINDSAYNGGPYQVTVTAKSSTGIQSSPSAAASVNIQEKPFIRVTSPNGGETWVMGAQHPITWDSNYLDQTGTIYLYYWLAGAWRPITSMQANSNTNSIWQWTIPTDLPTPPTSEIPKNHMAWTSIYIGNWLNSTGSWQCWDTNDQAFKILENGWAFTISGADKGGATLFFNTDGTFDGYGISFKKEMFKIQGTYTIGANGLISGAYTLTDFVSGNLLVSGTIAGTPNLNATTMTMTLKDTNNPPATVFTMSGVWNSDLNMPADSDWSVQISGSAKATINPLVIVAVEDPNNNNETCANLFSLSGAGTFSDGSTTISIDGSFFFTPSKTVYGFYQLNIGGNTEEGTLSGTLNPTTGKFTFDLVSSNGDKYTWVGAEVSAPPLE